MQILVVGLNLSAAPRTALAAGGAYAVDDAEIGPPGACKVESWASFGQGSNVIATTSPACTLPFVWPLEVGAQFQRANLGGWATSAAMKAKANIIPVTPGGVGVAIVGGLGYDLLASQSTGGFVAVPLTWQVNPAFKLNVNAGWLYDRVADLNWLTWGAGVEWAFVQNTTLIAEVYGQTGHRVTPSSVTDPRIQAGIRFTPVPILDIDVIYGRNITGENVNWVTLGLNVRFDVVTPIMR